MSFNPELKKYILYCFLPIGFIYPMKKLGHLWKGIGIFFLTNIISIGYYEVIAPIYALIAGYLTTSLILSYMIKKWYNENQIKAILK